MPLRNYFTNVTRLGPSVSSGSLTESMLLPFQINVVVFPFEAKLSGVAGSHRNPLYYCNVLYVGAACEDCPEAPVSTECCGQFKVLVSTFKPLIAWDQHTLNTIFYHTTYSYISIIFRGPTSVAPHLRLDRRQPKNRLSQIFRSGLSGSGCYLRVCGYFFSDSRISLLLFSLQPMSCPRGSRSWEGRKKREYAGLFKYQFIGIPLPFTF